MSKQRAVLDTSFWSAAVHIGVDPYLPLYFEMPLWVPTSVFQEIERIGYSTPRLREDQQRFRLLVEDGRVKQVDPASPYPRFGRGEAACLAIARELSVVLLINELPAYTEAKRIGIRAVTVPEIVVRLAWREIISPQKAHRLLDSLANSTTGRLIDQAKQMIDKGGLKS